MLKLWHLKVGEREIALWSRETSRLQCWETDRSRWISMSREVIPIDSYRERLTLRRGRRYVQAYLAKKM